VAWRLRRHGSKDGGGIDSSGDSNGDSSSSDGDGGGMDGRAWGGGSSRLTSSGYGDARDHTGAVSDVVEFAKAAVLRRCLEVHEWCVWFDTRVIITAGPWT
jgi:hypothetical protein